MKNLSTSSPPSMYGSLLIPEYTAATLRESDNFPVRWLSERIEHILLHKHPEQVCKPDFNPGSVFGKLVSDYHFTDAETVLVSLALASTYMPELLQPLTAAAANATTLSSLFTGGFFFKGSANFQPTVRTAVFLLAGNDPEKRAHYAAYFHRQQAVFTSGIVTCEPCYPNAVFLDHRIIFSDQFLGTALQGELPRLDGDPDFPVKRSKATHLLSDVILEEKTKTAIGKLRRFARNMEELWLLNAHGKIRNNFIAIFSGDPGTGKSYAAEAVGNEFGLPVYKVNFAQMVSKYIGETEKNLEKVFDRFDKQPCILFFDEAESIFSKRTEVGDSHDQHANNLQSYLLQKVEEFSGIIILATNVQNLTQYFDRAFQRRFRLIVQFEFPDYPERLQLWNNSLFGSFTFEKDLTERLAMNYQLSGGSIYNVVSDAVLEALDKQQTELTFDLIAPALEDEFKKTSRKYEVCTDEMVKVNPVRRFGPNYEQRRNF